MTPIQTRYKGYAFRSRLEARWAVFLDTVGMKWEYEKEGYNLGDAGLYLPDFHLKSQTGGPGCFLEIKGQFPTTEEMVKCQRFGQEVGPIYMFWGMPGSDTGFAFEGDKRFPIVIVFEKGKSQLFHSFPDEVKPGIARAIDKDWIMFPDLNHAICAARGARFEYGEYGPVKFINEISYRGGVAVHQSALDEVPF